MSIFKSYTFTWWQIGIFKLALLAIGALIGAFWQEFFSTHFLALILIAVATSAYTCYVSFRQWGRTGGIAQ